MQFVFPDFLWASLAIVIPIIIHIFNFRRTKRVFFSNVVLLKEIKTETNQFRKLKHFLILLMRIGFVIFLVLAFAQPYIPSQNAKSIQNTQGLVSIYADNSFSMQSEVGNEKLLDLSTQYINDLIKVFPKSARFQLVTNRFENQEQFPITAQKIEDKLTELKFAPQIRSLTTINQRQQSLLEKHSPSTRNQIFWFSDFQKSTAGDIEKLRLDTLNQYYLVPIKAEKNANIAIDSVWLANPFIKSNESNQIQVLIRNNGQEAKENLVLKLFIDEKQVSTATANIASQGNAIAQFNFLIEGQGDKPCKISFEDFPVVFDNEYYFVLNASPSVNILNLVAENEVFIPNVYANESVFKIQNLNINNIDYNRLNTAEMIVLNGIESAEGELKTQLIAFVKKGGTLVIFPPTKPKEKFVKFLNELNINTIQTINSDTLGKSKTNELNLIDIQNPFFRGIFDKVPSNMQMPISNPVLSFKEGNILLNHKNRTAFLSQISFAQGNTFLFSTPLNEQYTNFPRHAIFVPIMYRIASLSKSAEQRLGYNFQEKTIVLNIPEIPKNTTFSLKYWKDNNKNLIRPAQKIEGEQLWLEIPEQIVQAGYYELLANDKPIRLLAFNYPKEESVTDFYTLDKLKSIFGKQKNIQIFDGVKNKNFINDFKDKNLQFNLWKYMLIIALVFLLLEILFIRFLK